MKLSAKGQYGLASMTHLALNYGSGDTVTIMNISSKLGISKIYLEQVFSLLKRAGLVLSIKGSQGGYRLSRPPGEITAYDILSAIENSLIENASPPTSGHIPSLDMAIETIVYTPLCNAIKSALSSATLEDLLAEAQRRSADESMMYFI